MSTFLINAPKWQCYCCHLTTGCKAIAILESVTAVVGFSVLIGSAALNMPWMLYSLYIVSACVCLAAGISAVLMFIGIKRTRKDLLYPYVFVHGLIILVVCALIVISLLVSSDSENPPKPTTIRLVASLGAALAFSLGLVFCIYTVTRAIHFMRNLERRNVKRFSKRVRRDRFADRKKPRMQMQDEEPEQNLDETHDKVTES